MIAMFSSRKSISHFLMELVLYDIIFIVIINIIFPKYKPLLSFLN